MHDKSITIRSVPPEQAKLFTVGWDLATSDQLILRAAETFQRLKAFAYPRDERLTDYPLLRLALLCVLEATPDGEEIFIENRLAETKRLSS